MMDGQYVAKGRTVRREPQTTPTGFTMGFKVCELSDGVGDRAAEVIAEALNQHRHSNPDEH